MTNKRGFTMAELLIVVAIIGVLVAIAIPVFSNQLEKSREATDLANVRSAYAEVMNAAILEDKSSGLFIESEGRYEKAVPLKQAQDGWTMDTNQLVVGGIAFADGVHWLGSPKANSQCRVYYSMSDQAAYLKWGGETHINTISAKDFLTPLKLEQMLGSASSYKYNVINSNESYEQGEGTKAFLDFATQNGFDLKDYGATTWQMYVKESNGSTSYLKEPAIYWSSIELGNNTVGNSVPVIGYRDGKYDVYCAEVVTYNIGTNNQYNSIKNNFANVTEAGGRASFQFSSYDDAKKAYDEILAVYEANGTLTSNDMKKAGLTD